MYKREKDFVNSYHSIPVRKAIMVSYINTSEAYFGVSEMDNAEHCTEQSVYINQIPANDQILPNVNTPENYTNQDNFINQENCVVREIYNHDDYINENYTNQENYPTLTPRFSSCDPAQREQLITYGCTHFCENYSFPQYNTMQYTPLTPEPVSHPVFHLQPTQYQNCNYMAKRHRAQITILPTSKGNFKAVVKRKRKRTVFTTGQVEALEKIFKTKQYINREERQDIVKKLQINDKAVKIWFQNRRLKSKRMPDECSEESEDCSNIGYSIEERSPSDIARLELVESQITNKTDEFGYVTLDDGVMGDLVNVIDDFLMKSNTDFPSTSNESDSSPIYEPISPASISESNDEDNASYWRPSEPNESLQRLFDLQTMLPL